MVLGARGPVKHGPRQSPAAGAFTSSVVPERFFLHPSASQDLRSATERYRKSNQDIAADFVKAVHAAIATIVADHPLVPALDADGVPVLSGVQGKPFLIGQRRGFSTMRAVVRLIESVEARDLARHLSSCHLFCGSRRLRLPG